MFKRLFWQMIGINLLITFSLFIVLTGGCYWLVKLRLIYGINEMLLDSQAIINGQPPQHAHHPDAPPPLPSFLPLPPPRNTIDEKLPPMMNFALIDEKGHFVNGSNNAPLINVARTSPYHEIVSKEINGSYYYYIRDSYGSNDFIVWHDFAHEQRLLNNLLFALLITTAICTAIAFFCSRFLANRALRPIKKSWQQQCDFIANAAHELRTPLAVIRSNLDVLKTDSQLTIADNERWLHNIDIKTNDMTKLVSDLLFLARSDSQQLPLQKQLYAIDQLVTETAASFQPLCTQHKLTLQYNCQSNKEIFIDPHLIKQLVNIIIDNAVKFAKATILIETSFSDHLIQIRCSDDGPGIAETERRNVLQRFHKLDSSRNSQGHGLGLAIAEWICHKHNGSIFITQSHLNGAQININLPTKKNGST